MERSITASIAGEATVRRRIVAAAREYFFAHGFRGVTMDDLARELGMSKKTLYAHFAGKTALLEAVLLEKFTSLEEELSRITTECATDFAGGLHRVLACVQRHTEEIQPPFLRDMQREAPDLFKIVEGRRREVIRRYFGRLLNEGQSERLIRNDVPIDVVIEILLGAVQGVMNPAKLAELGLTPKAGFSAILGIILEGLLTRQGRAKL